MQLRIRYRDNKEKSIALDPAQSLRFGSSSKADVRLTGADIKPVHFGVVFQKDRFVIAASKAAGQIDVNGRLVASKPLAAGDRITVGPLRIEVLADDDGAADHGLQELEPLESVDPTRDDWSDVPEGLDPLSDETISEPGVIDGLESLQEGAADPAPGSLDDLPDEPDDWETATPLAGDTKAKKKSQPGGPGAASRFSAAAGRLARTRVFQVSMALLLVAAIAIPIVVMVLGMPTATDRFLAADEALHAGRYQQAMADFDKFLDWYPDHRLTALAHVKHDLAELRLEAERRADWPRLVPRIIASVPDWDDGVYSAAAQSGLASLLAEAVQDLLNRAQLAAERAALDESGHMLTMSSEALQLLRRHVPPSLQQTAGLDRLELERLRIERELQEPGELNAALAAIRAADGPTALQDAHQARDRLLDRYPAMSTSGQLRSAMQQLASRLARQVRVDAPATPAIKDDVSETLPIVLVPEDRRVVKTQVRTSQSMTTRFPGSGVAHTLDAATGKLLWSRFVGPQTRCPPLALGAGRSSSVLLVDESASQLLRIESSTGQVLWRQSVSFAAAPMVVSGNTVFVTVAAEPQQAATADHGSPDRGQMIELDLDTGGVIRRYEFPQPVDLEPVVDVTNQRMIVTGRESMLYVISLERHRCEQVVYVGHAPGTAAVPLVFDTLIAAPAYDAVGTCSLFVLDPKTDYQLVQTLVFPGAIVHREMTGRSFVVLTDEGRLFRVGPLQPADPRRPLTVDELTLPQSQAISRSMHIYQGKLWLAGEGVSVYSLTGSNDLARPELQLTADEETVSSLWFGDRQLVVSYGGGPDAECYLESYQLDPASSTAELVWTNRLGLAPAAVPTFHSSRPLFCYSTGNGGLNVAAVQPNAWTLEAHLAGSPAVVESRAGAVVINDRIWFWPGAGSGQLLALDAEQVSAPPVLSLRLAAPLACPPAAFGSDLLVVLIDGRVLLIDAVAGQLIGQPLLLPHAVSAGAQWVASQDRVALYDGHQLVRLDVDRDRETVVEIAETHACRANGRLVATPDAIWFVDSRGDELQRWPWNGGPTAAVVESSGLVSGPFMADSRVWAVCQSADEAPRLMCWDTDGAVVQNHSVPQRKWLDVRSAGGRLWLTSYDGRVWQVTSTGLSDRPALDAARPLAFGPLPGGAQNERLVLVTADGCVLNWTISDATAQTQ